jgi:WGR domain
MIKLTRTDPARNMHRFYAPLQLTATLFGEWAFVAEWGPDRRRRPGSGTGGVSRAGARRSRPCPGASAPKCDAATGRLGP